MSVQHFIGDYVHFSCSLPGSADSETRCNLYFGETSRPVQTTTIRKTKSSTKKKWFCQFYVTIDDFLRHLCFVQQKEASCDYSLGSEHNSLSPRSDGRNLTGKLVKTWIHIQVWLHCLSLTLNLKSLRSWTDRLINDASSMTQYTVCLLK